MTGGRKELMEFLEKLEIKSHTVEHPAVFTVEAMMPYLKDIPNGIVSKNLFLKDKKKKGLWLVSCSANREVKLNDLAKKVGASGGFRFADEAIMVEKLGVGQGCATGFSLLNDRNQDVKFILDAEFTDYSKHDWVYFHPMENTATTGVSPEDFIKFAKATGHDPIVVNFDE
ncbi:predicted protein [Nematostella vectensis]|uniref:PrdX deacylase domain-containing protein 1 n=1 Tax=Nematostella vectensis TaxID=45351 RepID=A7S7R8_NEMVE|nr:predicted protein [Nematostella vectensis]|eukprot:XP_001632303.1 predicted protein [Nematostella vectensis]